MKRRLRRSAISLLALLKTPNDSDRRWPGYLPGGRVRTSTVVLIVAFLAVWWTYDTYRPEPSPNPPPAQVVPPGFVPDPDYTWVPRSNVEQPPQTVTVTVRPTSTPPAPPSPTTELTSSPPPPLLPPFLLPPPFGPPTTPQPPPSEPSPGPTASTSPPPGAS